MENMKHLALSGKLTLDQLLANPEECARGLQEAVETAQSKARTRKLSHYAGADFVSMVQRANDTLAELGNIRLRLLAQVTSAERLPNAYRGLAECTGIYLRADETIFVTRAAQDSGDVTKGNAAWVVCRKSRPSERPTVERAISLGLRAERGIVWL